MTLSTLSPSRISTWVQCPLQYRYQYVDKLPETPSSAAHMGTLVHRALELLMLRPAAKRTQKAADVDLATACKELVTEEFCAGVDEVEFLHQARALVGNYFTLEDPRQVDPIGLELRMSADIGGVVARGIIDRLDSDAGWLVVTDYKTGKAPREAYASERFDGLRLYAFLCHAVLGRMPSKIRLMYLGGTPTVLELKPSVDMLNSALTKAGYAIEGIREAARSGEYSPRTGPLCPWCSYREICPACP